MAKVELNNISKVWGNFTAVDNFDLTIEDKEFWFYSAHLDVVKLLQ